MWLSPSFSSFLVGDRWPRVRGQSFLLDLRILGGRLALELVAGPGVEPADALGDRGVNFADQVPGAAHDAATHCAARHADDGNGGNGQREKCVFQDETPSITRTNRRCLIYRPNPYRGQAKSEENTGSLGLVQKSKLRYCA